MDDWTGRKALVTGGASGIGRATALALAARGVEVAVVDKDRAGAESAAAAAKGARVVVVEADLELPEAPARAFAAALQALGRIDILVNAAGVTSPERTLDQATPEGWRRIQTINLDAPLWLMQAFARHAADRGGGGRIVNVTSSSGFHVESTPGYSSTKAALTHLTRVAARDLGPQGITVNAVAPGLTDTAMTRRIWDRAAMEAATREGPLANFVQRPADAEDVAAAILFLCSCEARQVTGHTLHTSAKGL
jgi:3-oxoacyl-[acyl-carrier protein] reductase